MITNETFKSTTACMPRNHSVSADMGTFMNEKISYILKHRGHEHPFLTRYARKGLPAPLSKLLYLETMHYFKYLPFYVCGISTITRDEAVLRTIVFNALDELGQTKSHANIYHEFLIRKGITQNEIYSYKCLPSTQALNDGICALYSTPPLQKALGALFADEVMSAGMAMKYDAGLIAEGVSARGRSFWSLYMEVKVAHSNTVFNVMKQHLQTAPDHTLFLEGIDQYMHLMEMYWDGMEILINARRS